MQPGSLDIIAKLVDIGTAGIVLVILWFYRKDTQAKIDDQDKQIREAHNRAMDAAQKMTEVTVSVKASIDNNTKAITGLPEKIDYILRKSKRG